MRERENEREHAHAGVSALEPSDREEVECRRGG